MKAATIDFSTFSSLTFLTHSLTRRPLETIFF